MFCFMPSGEEDSIFCSQVSQSPLDTNIVWGRPLSSQRTVVLVTGGDVLSVRMPAVHTVLVTWNAATIFLPRVFVTSDNSKAALSIHALPK